MIRLYGDITHDMASEVPRAPSNRQVKTEEQHYDRGVISPMKVRYNLNVTYEIGNVPLLADYTPYGYRGLGHRVS